jgi:hypothetical protein
MANPSDPNKPSGHPGWIARRTPAEQQTEPAAWEAGWYWIQAKWQGAGNPACPYCKNTTYWVGAPVVFATVTGVGGTPPMFPITCRKCGQTVLVNALVASGEALG